MNCSVIFRFSPVLQRLAVGLCVATAGRAAGDAFSGYGYLGTIALPVGADVFDVLPDGRILVLVDAAVFVESSPGSGGFVAHGILPDAPPLEFPSFVRVSPDGTRVAVGDGFASVGVFSFPGLSGQWLSAAHYDGAWWNNTQLALSGGTGNSVTLLDTDSPDPDEPTNPAVIVNTGIAGGIAFDVSGNLFTGTGFGSPPHQTGDVRGFPSASWISVLSGAEPLDFLADGLEVVDVLSAASLGFDVEGNLHIGGGDFFGVGDLGFVALVRAVSVAASMNGDGPANTGDSEVVRLLDPQPENSFEFYSITYDPVRQRLLLQDFGDPRLHVYANFEPIPAVSVPAMIAALLATAGAGAVVLERLRRTGSVAVCSRQGIST
jgi:hypothetical protein